MLTFNPVEFIQTTYMLNIKHTFKSESLGPRTRFASENRWHEKHFSSPYTLNL